MKKPATRHDWRRYATDPGRHRFAQLRQEAWRGLGHGGAWTERAAAVRLLTVILNGHHHDITEYGTHPCKSSYFEAPKPREALWDEWRDSRRSALGPDPLQWLAKMMLQRERWENHGRRKYVIDSHRDEIDWFEHNFLDGTPKQYEHDNKRDMGDPRTAEILGAQGNRTGHVVSIDHPSGGDHDLAWLTYDACRDGHTLEQHRDALQRRGRLTIEMKAVKEDVQRIVLAMSEAGVSHTATARIFGVNRKTITRTVERSSNVPVFPYGGKETSRIVTPLQADDPTRHREPQRYFGGRRTTGRCGCATCKGGRLNVAAILEQLDRRQQTIDRRLARIESTVTEIADTLTVSNRPKLQLVVN